MKSRRADRAKSRPREATSQPGHRVKSRPAFVVTLGRSKAALLAAVVVAALAALAPWLADLSTSVRAFLSVLALLIGLRTARSIRQLEGLALTRHGDGRWTIAKAGASVDATLDGHALIGPVASLRFRLADGRRWPILVIADAVPDDAFRELRVHLLKGGLARG